MNDALGDLVLNIATYHDNPIKWHFYCVQQIFVLWSKWFHIGLRSVAFFSLIRIEGFSFGRLCGTDSINCVCASHHLCPGWIARPAIEVVSDWSILSSQAFQKANDQETTCLLALVGPRTPHMLPKLGWMTGVIKGGWAGERGEAEWADRHACLWTWVFGWKVKFMFFHSFAWGKCVSDYTWAFLRWVPPWEQVRLSNVLLQVYYSCLTQIQAAGVYLYVNRLTFSMCCGVDDGVLHFPPWKNNLALRLECACM